MKKAMVALMRAGRDRDACGVSKRSENTERKEGGWTMGRSMRVLGLVVVMFVGSALLASADSTWIGPAPGTGDWGNDLNWDLAEPTASDNAYVNNGGTAEISKAGEECFALYLGEDGVESGYVETTAGSLSADYVYVGQHGTGVFHHTGGTVDLTGFVNSSLFVGQEPGSDGTYDLSDSGDLSTKYAYVGYQGAGEFNQDGGTHTNTSVLRLGYWTNGDGTYNLNSGSLECSDIDIGAFGGTGTFAQIGGANNVDNGLVVTDGSYQLGGTGQLVVAGVVSVSGYDATFTQTGSSHSVTDELKLATSAMMLGTCNLSGTGELQARAVRVGDSGTGRFNQDGGTHTVSEHLYLGYWPGSSGQYELDSGQLSVGTYGAYIGREGEGTFVQSGGSNTVDNKMYIGYSTGSTGGYVMLGGTLSVKELYVGHYGSGALIIHSASADITVTGKLHFGEQGRFNAVAGTTIHMIGSAFENESTDPADLAGLTNLELIFEGGALDTDPVEVAGEDKGNVLSGLTDNFALGTLTLGGVDIGKIALMDDNDNQPGWAGNECLYVAMLNVGPGSSLDLNGRDLYYLNGSIDPAAIILGGTPTIIDVPGAAAGCEGEPPGYPVTPTFEPAGSGSYGTGGMADPEPGGETTALSGTAELDETEVADAVQELADQGMADPFITLKMYYDPDELAALDLVENTLRLYWWDGAEWVLGGTTTAGLVGESEFASDNLANPDPASYGLGWTGLHMDGDYVWVNTNHASTFSVGGSTGGAQEPPIPEPAGLGLLGIALLALRRRSGRRR